MNSWAWKYFGHVPCFIAQALESVTDMFASVYALGEGSTMSKPVTRTAHLHANDIHLDHGPQKNSPDYVCPS